MKLHIDHGVETQLSDPKVRRSHEELLRSYYIKYEKFKSEFKKNRKLRASLYTQIAMEYAQLSDNSNFLKYVVKAFFSYPFRGRLKSTFRGFKFLIKSITENKQ